MTKGVRRENFYRRDPGAALAGMAGMSLEERGVYNTLIDLMYLTWRPVEDNRAYIAGHCGCAVQKLNPIIRRLIERRKLIVINVDGQDYLKTCEFRDDLDTPQIRDDRAYIDFATRTFVFERDGHTCVYCGDTAGPFELDHVHPVSRGGDDRLENLACACRPCNRSKGAKLVSEWMR
jgi:5-methylcytosine-specific restriction endonuclease McrA